MRNKRSIIEPMAQFEALCDRHCHVKMLWSLDYVKRTYNRVSPYARFISETGRYSSNNDGVIECRVGCNGWMFSRLRLICLDQCSFVVRRYCRQI